MERHAGFAAAVTVTEAYLNQLMRVEFQKIDPISGGQLFQLPALAPLPSGKMVRLSGIGLFNSSPALKLMPNSSNTVSMATSTVAFIDASLQDNAGTVLEERTLKIQVAANARVSFDIETAPNGLFLRVVPTTSTIDKLEFSELDGNLLPDWVTQALNAAPLRAAVNKVINALGPVRVSNALFPSGLHHVQSANFPSTGISLFEWFTIDEHIASTAIRVLDGCITVGINLKGFPPGVPSQLVDLNLFKGDSISYGWPKTTQDSLSSRPLLVPANISNGDISMLVNANVVRAIVDKVSAQVAGTPVSPGVQISRITMQPAFFIKPLGGREIAMKVDVTFTVDIAGAISGSVYLQFFSRGPAWFVYVGHTEINVPWWVNVAVVAVGLTLSAIFPMLAPLLTVGVIAAIDGIIPGVIDNATGAANNALKDGEPLAGGVITTSFHGPRGDLTNYKGTNSIHLSSEGLGASMTDVIPSVRFPESNRNDAVADLNCRLDAGSPEPYAFQLSLRSDLTSLVPDCSAQIIVYRADTGEEVSRTEGPFSSHSLLLLDHLSPMLYFVDTFRVQAKIFLNRVALEGLMFTSDTNVTVTDVYNRHHPYVSWYQHTAHFVSPNQTDPNVRQFWHRDTYPHIHRTAASARCLVLRQRANRHAMLNQGIDVFYRDTLDFDPSLIPFNRKMLCDYCFFGGPTKAEPFPQDDWFSR